MALIIILESLKFHKLKHERALQIGFVCLFLLNFSILVLPVGDRDFTRLFTAFDSLMAGNLAVQPAWELLNQGNMLLIGLMLLMNLVMLFFSFVYATLFVGEHDGMTTGQAVLHCLKALPAIFLLVLVMLLPAIVSVIFAFIPVLVFLLMMYFLPLNLSLDGNSISEAIRRSIEMTSKQRLFILFQTILLSLALTLPQNLLLSFSSQNQIVYAAISCFFIVIRSFAQGRLMGILYLFLVKKVPLVIPSKPSHPQ